MLESIGVGGPLVTLGRATVPLSLGVPLYRKIELSFGKVLWNV